MDIIHLNCIKTFVELCWPEAIDISNNYQYIVDKNCWILSSCLFP